MADEMPHPDDPAAIGEVTPPETRALPPEPIANDNAPIGEQNRDSLPGWPRVRFHPVHGRREFADPWEAAKVGQDDEKGDWRFKTAAAADMARTDTEAGLVIAHNMRSKLAAHDEAEAPIARNSASAQESIDTGHAEPL